MHFVVRITLVIAAMALLRPAGARADQASQSPDPGVAVVCGSAAGERQVCVADTTHGVTLVRPTGTAACELGLSWGFDEKSIWVRDGCSAEFALKTKSEGFGLYTPGRGFKVADTDKGELSIRLFAYLRYLNQRGLDGSFTDSFGATRAIKQRQDLQLNKVNVYFLGSIMSRKFRYVSYVWTQNSGQGLPAQVVVAGNLSYEFNTHARVGFGITSLPGVRSTEGNFPFWLGVDDRLLADAYFQPSFTTGVFATGTVAGRLHYNAMWGDNLSQLGVDAGELGNDMSTFSGALIWMPTTGEFGPADGFGDFEWHDKLATRVAAHYTYSDEDRQEQPGTEAPDNSQIRISDGSIVFTPALFGPGILITDVVDQFTSFDAGVKYHGFAAEGEYYWRRLNNFRGAGIDALPFTRLTDTGFQAQLSAMVAPQKAQLYVSGSKVNGRYGDPYDIRAGLNVYPWNNQVIRWNTEFIYLRRSPVGALSLPYTVGGNGPVFSSTLMLNF